MTLKSRLAALKKKADRIAPPVVAREAVCDRIERYTQELLAHVNDGVPLSPESEANYRAMHVRWPFLNEVVERVRQRENPANYPHQSVGG